MTDYYYKESYSTIKVYIADIGVLLLFLTSSFTKVKVRLYLLHKTPPLLMTVLFLG